MTPQVVNSFIDGFAACKPNGSPGVVLAFGATNEATNYAKGQRFAALVNAATAYVNSKHPGQQIYIAAAYDAEIGYGSPALARGWVAGYISRTKYAWYDVGDARGCSTTTGTCDNGWTLADKWYTAGGANYRQGFALPEIYNTTPELFSNEWVAAANYGHAKGRHRFFFGGALSQYFACHPHDSVIRAPYGCPAPYNTDQTPSAAWKDLYSAISPFQTNLPFSTDIASSLCEPPRHARSTRAYQ